MREEPRLERALGPIQVTAGGVGIIVGAGIYVLIGEAAGEAGSAVWASFLLSALLCGLTGLSYAELAGMFPSAAAEFEYTRQAFPEWLAFLVGWMMVAGLVVAAATVALGFGRYAGQFFDIEPEWAGLGLLVFLLIVGASGIRQAGLLIVGLSTVQVLGLLAVIAIGLPSFGDHSLSLSGHTSGIVSGAALVFFAFIGFDEVITLGEETKDPTRTVPRALLAALAISTALYIAVAVAAVSAIGAEQLAASERPLGEVVDTIAGSRSSDAIAVIALISTTNTTLLAVTAASRLTYGMAQQRAIPSWFGGVAGRTHVPLRSLISVVAVSMVCMFLGNLSLLAKVTDFSVYLVFLAVNATVIVLRFTRPSERRTFATPLAVGKVPLLPIAGIGSVFLLMSGLDGETAVVGAAVCVTGLFVGLLTDARSPVGRRRERGGG
ncbi:MAG: APC family permease [Dehalococcoidia bacterium]